MKKSIHQLVLKLWYPKSIRAYILYSPIYLLLSPLSILYWLLFKLNYAFATKLPVPVVVVGNLTVGGTGKTPLVIELIKIFSDRGIRVGVVTRGYKSKSNYSPFIIDPFLHTPENCGDEPLLIAKKSRVPVAVAIDRIASCKLLIKQFDVQVIISDDGLQNFKLPKDYQIAVVDGDRVFGNGLLLPAGPLRQSQRKLLNVDQVVVNGDTKKQFSLLVRQKLSRATVVAENFINLKTKEQLPIMHFANRKVIALAGIGNPNRFFSTLDKYKVDYAPVAMPNHYNYKNYKIDNLDLPIITTEKDAIKLASKFPTNDNIFYLSISLEFDSQFINLLNSFIGDLCIKTI